MGSKTTSLYVDQRDRVIPVRILKRAARDSAGTILIEFSARGDVPLLNISGASGRIDLAVSGGRLDGNTISPAGCRRLDAEDTVGVADGHLHSVVLVSAADGVHLFLDGYESFTTTLPVWLAQIEAESIVIDPDAQCDINRVALWNAPLNVSQVAAQAVKPKPIVEFAGAELSPLDMVKLHGLTHGALRARFRTRGRGQSGVLIEAAGTQGKISLSIERGDIVYAAELTAIRSTSDKDSGRGMVAASSVSNICYRAPGHWDDGTVHDVLAVAGRGAVELYVDGYQVLHAPGQVFLEYVGELSSVTAGTAVDGTRLSGEVSEAEIFDSALGDHQVKTLAGVKPLTTVAVFDGGLENSKSYRIPSILRLKSGVLLAGADQRVSTPNDAPNHINFALRRSEDEGATWSDVQVVVEYPGEGLLGACVIDSVLVQDRSTGRVFLAIDHYPGGYGQPNSLVGTGFTANGERILVNKEGDCFRVPDSGEVFNSDGVPVGLRVDRRGDVTHVGGDQDGSSAGNIYLAPGTDPNETLFEYPTCYLIMLYSDDDGVTWSPIRHMNREVKEEWMSFCGTSPGTGIQLEHGSHAGRLILPIYYNNDINWLALSAAVIYSDNHGETWQRGASPNDGRVTHSSGRIDSRTLSDSDYSTHESTLVEDHMGRVHIWMRNQSAQGKIAHAVSEDGGETWGAVTFVEQIPEIWCQPNALKIVIPENLEEQAGRDNAIVFANASQMLPFRGRGEIRLSLDDGETWAHNRVLEPRHYVYQCMCQLSNGDIGILWEREVQGLFFTRVPLEWLLDSRSTLS